MKDWIRFLLMFLLVGMTCWTLVTFSEPMEPKPASAMVILDKDGRDLAILLAMNDGSMLAYKPDAYTKLQDKYGQHGLLNGLPQTNLTVEARSNVTY